MNISQRLRTCARHTGLDAVIELLNEAADEIERLSAAQPADVTDEQIIAIKKATKAADPTQQWGDTLAFARAILALRPVQVPMTREQAMAIVQSNPDTMTAIRMTEAHHFGITDQAKKETP